MILGQHNYRLVQPRTCYVEPLSSAGVVDVGGVEIEVATWDSFREDLPAVQVRVTETNRCLKARVGMECPIPPHSIEKMPTRDGMLYITHEDNLLVEFVDDEINDSEADGYPVCGKC